MYDRVGLCLGIIHILVEWADGSTGVCSVGFRACWRRWMCRGEAAEKERLTVGGWGCSFDRRKLFSRSEA